MKWTENRITRTREGWDSNDARWRVIKLDNGTYRLIDFEGFDPATGNYRTMDFSTLGGATAYAERVS